MVPRLLQKHIRYKLSSLLCDANSKRTVSVTPYVTVNNKLNFCCLLLYHSYIFKPAHPSNKPSVLSLSRLTNLIRSLLARFQPAHQQQQPSSLRTGNFIVRTFRLLHTDTVVLLRAVLVYMCSIRQHSTKQRTQKGARSRQYCTYGTGSTYWGWSAGVAAAREGAGEGGVSGSSVTCFSRSLRATSCYGTYVASSMARWP